MVAILTTAAEVARGLHSLSSALSIPEAKYTHLIDNEALQDEFGRFRVWSGNLGALQKGHSSLDYRLRDSPLLSENVIKLLKELEENISHILAVVTGVRLPYEELAKTERIDEDEDDDFFSEDEDEDENSSVDTSKTELEQRFAEIVDIVDNLYKLSVRIRKPTLRNRSLKAASYKPKDKDTGVDILDQYATLDRHHTIELVEALRAPHTKHVDAKDDVLVERLSQAITLRRRQFKYWKRHRDKLSVIEVLNSDKTMVPPELERPDHLARKHTEDTVEAQFDYPVNPVVEAIKLAPSQRTGKTLLSGTEATHHHQTLDDVVDLQSVTSYATTVRDLSGRGIELPPPPKAATGDKDFECPYCFIICPARYGRGRPWRTHLLQDLQPYVCTYAECQDHHLLFRSRREWTDHEGEHRKAWRCPEHPSAIFKSHQGLENHLRKEHSDTIMEHQLESIVTIGETSTIDTRENCPICLVSSQDESVRDNFHNHIANHLERLASFALPTTDTIGDDSEGGSGVAYRGGTITTNSSQDPADDDDKENSVGRTKSPEPSIDLEAGPDAPAHRRLFSETLGGLPDDSDKRLNMLLTDRTKTEDVDNKDDLMETLKDFQEHPLEDPPAQSTEQADYEAGGMHHDGDSDSSISVDYFAEQSEGRWPLLSVSEIPTIRSLYRTLKLKVRDQSYAPVDAYNQLISLCFYDITRLQVDAIVNSANKGNKISPRSFDTLNRYIHQVAGPGLLEECKQVGPMNTGESILTAGYNLPSPHVIHTARPNYSGAYRVVEFNNLNECYRSSLELALSRGIETIAFPCIGTGGCGFPPAVAARIALQEVREYLDKHINLHGAISLKRIVFCVFNARDEQAYKTLIPVFFPPTHGDIENTVMSKQTDIDRPRLSRSLEDVYKEVEQLSENLTDLSTTISDFPPMLLVDLIAISSGLRSLRTLLDTADDSSVKLTARILADIDLICSVLHDVYESLTEVGEQIKYAERFYQPATPSIWTDHDLYLDTKHGLNSRMLVELCRDFVKVLGDVVERGAPPPYELDTMRVRLANYRLKQTGQGDDRVRDKFEEVMYTREFQRDAISSNRNDIIKLYQIPSLARLYQIGELERKPTNSIPDHHFNYTVCLIREDITRIETDVICNSTDRAFSGMGTLDRAIFRKGGPELQRDCSKFGVMNEGNITVTPGYGLPARYVIHTIPPETYRPNTKDILRQIYREILWTTSSLKATSLAIPALGTGMLSYPRRDCASLAIEEVKRFLETAKGSHHIESIVFCVFGSNDEFIYKSLLPVFFPPGITNLKESAPASLSPRSDSSNAQGRTLFNSLGEAVRGLGHKNELVGRDVRPLSSAEEETFIRFEQHARTCGVCHDITKLCDSGQLLCFNGYDAAQHLLQNVHLRDDGSVYENISEGSGHARKIEISPSGRTAVTNSKAEDRLKLEHHAPLSLQFDGDIEGRSNTNRNRERDHEFELRESAYRESAYVKCMELLTVVKRNFQEHNPLHRFVNVDIPYYLSNDHKAHLEDHSTKEVVSSETGKAVARMLYRSLKSGHIEPMYENDTDISVSSGKAELYIRDDSLYNRRFPSMTLDLTPLTPVLKSGSVDVVVTAKPNIDLRFNAVTNIVFRCKNETERERLYALLRDAKNEKEKEKVTLHEGTETGVSSHHKIVDDSRPRQEGPQVRFDLPSVPLGEPGTEKVKAPSLLTQPLQNLEAPKLENEISSTTGGPESTIPLEDLLVSVKLKKRIEKLLLQKSYIDGIHEEEIARTLGEDVIRVKEALRGLENDAIAYCTIDDRTWTSIHWKPPSPISGPSASKSEDKERHPESKTETGPIMEMPNPATANKLRPMLPDFSHFNIDNFFTYLDSALDYHGTEVDQTQPYQVQTDEEDVDLSTVRNPRPTTPDGSQKRPIPPAVRWTKIDRWIVSPEALTDAKEDFELQGDHVIVYRVLPREEIVKLAEATRKLSVRDHEYV